MEKRVGIGTRDSYETETQAKENFIVLDELLVTHKARSLIAQCIGVSGSAITGYARHGHVSLYATNALANLFEVERDYFSGKKILMKNDNTFKKIEEKILQLKGPEGIVEDSGPSISEPMVERENLDCFQEISLAGLLDYFAEIVALKVVKKIQQNK